MDFKYLKSEITKLQGEDIIVSTTGKTSGIFVLNKLVCMDYIGANNEKGFSICNLNKIIEEDNSMQITIKEKDIMDFSISDYDNLEIEMDFGNNERVLLVKC